MSNKRTVLLNDHEGRKNQKPLTVQQEKAIVQMLNAMIEYGGESDRVTEALQMFINHYQNLSHHMACTTGLWATDVPEKVSDPEKMLYQITF